MGMVVTRRAGEAVRIGDALVTIVRLRNGRVKLRVDAPRETPIEIPPPVSRGIQPGPQSGDRARGSVDGAGSFDAG